MKIFLDTNIIIDILTKRQPLFSDSYKCYENLILSGHKIYVSALSVADVMYITKKNFSDSSSQYKAVENYLKTMRIANIKKSDIKFAFSSSFNDFEDALQASCAKRHHSKYIITRNIKHYTTSPIKAIQPEDYLKLNQ